MRILKAHIHDYDESFYENAFRYLSIDRQQKAMRYRNKADQLSCILGDYLIRKAVTEAAECELGDVCILHTETGKPFIAYPDNNGLHVSLSHSGGIVVVAIDTSPVGVDVEMVSDIEDAFLKHVLSEEEAKYVGCFQHRFFEVWTMKEAYLKCTGMGISGCDSLRDVCVFGLPRMYHVNVVESTNKYVMSACVIRNS